MPNNSLSLPDQVVQLLAAADRDRGFPAGTMASLMQQEVGGQPQFLTDPTLPHYPSGVAPNGKKSSAFGPFGLLESTTKDPGYGVAPLKDKSLPEQIRFAADYLDARSRSAGSLAAGLAGYGEGAKYSMQVARRRDGASPSPVADVVAAAGAGAPAPAVVADGPAPAPITFAAAGTGGAATPVLGAPLDPEKDPWTQYTRLVGKTMAERFAPAADMPAAVAATHAPTRPVAPEDFLQLAAMDVGNRPSFGVFQGLSRLGRRQA